MKPADFLPLMVDTSTDLIAVPPMASTRFFWKYYPGADVMQRPQVQNIVTGGSTVTMLPYDAPREDVRQAVIRTLRLAKMGMKVDLLIPFYATKYVPANRHNLIAAVPHSNYSEWNLSFRLPAITRGRVNWTPKTYPGWLTELTTNCRDARGYVYPMLWQDALKRLCQGEFLMSAIGNAYEKWAPGIVSGLAEFATDKKTMLDRIQLVRRWERVKVTEYRCDYYRNGRDAMDFMVDFGAIAREGKGRIKWGPLFANYYSWKLTQGKGVS